MSTSQKKKHISNDNRIAISTSLRIKPTPSNHNEHKLSIDNDENNNTLLSSFTHILNSKQTQLQCYNQTCSQSIHEFLNGCNCTFFVYGQTGSGKTHTLFGPPNSFHSESLASTNVDEVFKNVEIPTTWGIFPRVVLHLLSNQQQQNNKQQQSQSNNVGITATAVEIYMDNCYDLIHDKQKISIEGYGKSNKVSGRGSFLETTQVKRDGSGKWIPPRTLVNDKQQPLNNNEGYGMRGAKSTILSNITQLLDFMRIVEATRTSKSHKLNERSSRSHCVITLSIPSVSNAKYMLVDLAGSERIMKSGTIQCELKAAEAKNINTSLTSLGRCITALSKGDVFVPYRDSVLTMLLKQSLGGRCYTSVIITGTEDSEMRQETISSIKFGKRCSKVVNNRQAKERRGSSITNNDERKKNLLSELQLIDAELSSMTKTGKAGGLNTSDFPKSLQVSFMSNMNKYKQHKKAYESIQQQIKAGKITSSILKTKQYEHSQVKNLQGILLRSMTTGIWTDPSPAYMKYVQRRIDIVSTLRGMNVNGSDEEKIVDIDIPMTFDHLLLGFEG